MQGFVRTVVGDLSPSELGVTYVHEHLLTEPRAGQGRDLHLDDEDKMASELDAFVELGGSGILEATVPEFGRSPEGLRRLAGRTGVNIVAVTGHQQEDFWRGVEPVDCLSEGQLAEQFAGDLLQGMEGTGVRAGAIKVGTSLGEITPAERRVIRAAARAQRATGAPIVTHTTAGTMALDQARALESAGADLTKVCVGHLDRRLRWEEHLDVARTGVYLGYDQVSKEKYGEDEERARFVTRLAEAGYGHRICLGGDLARRSYHPAWGGGPGLTYLLGSFVPLLLRHGMGESAVRRLLVDNPARLLTWHRSRKGTG